jgi:hypothetical protein
MTSIVMVTIVVITMNDQDAHRIDHRDLASGRAFARVPHRLRIVSGPLRMSDIV